jgi:uncharacterized protein YndB with AHSA1/START domain
MMRGGRWLLLLAAMQLSAPAIAEVKGKAPDGFTIRHEGLKQAAPADAWAALVDWGGWWPDSHTYSGKAANIYLEVEPDGELEEVWDGGNVLHGSVLQAQPGKLLRLGAAFGPLQSIPVNGVLDIALKPEGNATRIILTYRVGGPASLDVGRLAAPVDQVFGEAFARLLAHASPPPEPEK